ncbi:MAG: LytR/AlgR family response regulator transcription factor, partial [Terriglobales bacterium]
MKPSVATIKVLIVDDEPLACENIVQLLRDEAEFTVAGRCHAAPEAMDFIRRERPDLVFLDIHMPGLSGLQMLTQLAPAMRPHVIFVTAYDEHALKAFELNAVDYLLKPFSRERFQQALARIRSILRRANPQALWERVDAVMEALTVLRGPTAGTAPAATEPAGRAGHLLLRHEGEIFVVPMAQIRWIKSEGDYLKIHAGAKSWLTRMTLLKILEKLDPAVFVRIHKSTIVNITCVSSMRHGSNSGDYLLQLGDGTSLKATRMYA